MRAAITRLTARKVLATVGAGLVLALMGCSAQQSSSGQNSQVTREVQDGRVLTNPSGCTTLCNQGSSTTRFDTPGNFPAIVRICNGDEGMYVSESSTGEVNVIINDPGCGYRGTNPGGGGNGAPQHYDH